MHKTKHHETDSNKIVWLFLVLNFRLEELHIVKCKFYMSWLLETDSNTIYSYDKGMFLCLK